MIPKALPEMLPIDPAAIKSSEDSRRRRFCDCCDAVAAAAAAAATGEGAVRFDEDDAGLGNDAALDAIVGGILRSIPHRNRQMKTVRTEQCVRTSR